MLDPYHLIGFRTWDPAFHFFLFFSWSIYTSVCTAFGLLTDNHAVRAFADFTSPTCHFSTLSLILPAPPVISPRFRWFYQPHMSFLRAFVDFTSPTCHFSTLSLILPAPPVMSPRVRWFYQPHLSFLYSKRGEKKVCMEGERGLFTILPSKPLPHPQHGRSTTTSSTTTSSTTTRSTTAIKTTSSITCNTLALSTISSTKHIYWYHNYSTTCHKQYFTLSLLWSLITHINFKSCEYWATYRRDGDTKRIQCK